MSPCSGSKNGLPTYFAEAYARETEVQDEEASPTCQRVSERCVDAVIAKCQIREKTVVTNHDVKTYLDVYVCM